MPAGPLAVDPEVLARMRPMGPEHVRDVCRLHAAAMGDSLWARLGHHFLATVYSGMLEHPDFIGFVYEEDDRVRGFIAGSSNAHRMFRDILKRRFFRLAGATVRGLVRRPRAAGYLLRTRLYFRRSTPRGTTPIPAESMFCSFEPELRGRRISGLINKLLFDELAARGHRWVKITTEADNEGAVRQLTSWGFEQVGRFRFYGKDMVTWRLDLEASERVDRPQRSSRFGRGPGERRDESGPSSECRRAT